MIKFFYYILGGFGVKKFTKIISTVLLLCIVLSGIVVLQPFAAGVDSAKSGNTTEYTYTYSITVSSKLCAIDYVFSYDKNLVLDKEKSSFSGIIVSYAIKASFLNKL